VEPDGLAFLAGRAGRRDRRLPDRLVAGRSRDARAAVWPRRGLRHLRHDRPDRDPFLDGWAQGPVTDAHLAHCADVWLYDLLSDSSPFTWWYDDSEDVGVAELRDWPTGPGAARLRALGEPDLAIRAELLALPGDERWAHPYWASASAAN
jgi:hypothetical protein